MLFPLTTWSSQSEEMLSFSGSSYLFDEKKGVDEAVFSDHWSDAGVSQFREFWFALPFSTWGLLLFLFCGVRGLTEGLPALGPEGVASTRHVLIPHISCFIKRKWAAGWPRIMPRGTGELLLVNGREEGNRYWEAVAWWTADAFRE